MKFSETPLSGVWLIELETLTDERGWFSRAYDASEFRAHGLEFAVVQCSASFNTRRDTLRGLHYQADPHGENKLVRCVRGAIFDVGVDLRTESRTVREWYAAELTADNGRMLYLPRGVAHGFQTLVDSSEVLYLIDHEYVPDASLGVRWDDPAFRIFWPEPSGERTISARDRSYPDFGA